MKQVRKLDYRMLIEMYNGSSRLENPTSPARSAYLCGRSDVQPKTMSGNFPNPRVCQNHCEVFIEFS